MLSKSGEVRQRTNVNNRPTGAPRLDPLDEPGTCLPVQAPHHAVEPKGHPPHWAALGSVEAPGKDRADLPLAGPIEMAPERMINKNDRVGGIEAAFDVWPGSETIDDPLVLRNQGFVAGTKLLFGTQFPAWQPLDLVDGMVRKLQGVADFPAKS